MIQPSRSDNSTAHVLKRRHKWAAVAVLFVLLVLLGIVALPESARLVVLNYRKPADVIVITVSNPYADDLYYWRALRLLDNHYGKYVVLPADASGTAGETEADEARTFIDATAGPHRARVSVCPETDEQFRSLDTCLARLHARTVLMVAPAPESRRSFRLYRKRLPQYSWYVAAIPDPAMFENKWWSNRQWAKSYVDSLQRLVFGSE